MTYEAEQVCIITVPEIQEATSGIAPSLHHENAVWIHNDSGTSPRLFLVDTSGEAVLAILNVNVADALDWEDMCSLSLMVSDGYSRATLVTTLIGEAKELDFLSCCY